jgi:hypothetical protein
MTIFETLGVSTSLDMTNGSFNFELIGGASALQTSTRVRLRVDFPKTNCRGISVDCGGYNSILCSASSSSGCDFVFVGRGRARGRDLFLEIRTLSLVSDPCTVVLLFATLVQHA